MTLVATVVLLPDEPVPIYHVVGKGIVIDPHVPAASGGSAPQPMVGGRLLVIADGKIKALTPT